MGRTVNNEVMTEALQNPDYKRILNVAARPYAHFIDRDDLSSAKHLALWNTLKNHDSTRENPVKLTTMLFSNMVWLCQEELKKTKHYRKRVYDINLNAVIARSGEVSMPTEELCVKEILDYLPTEDAALIHDRYYNGMTLKQIAAKNETSAECVRKNLEISLNNFKNLYNNNNSNEGDNNDSA